jgi:hypothetical protein
LHSMSSTSNIYCKFLNERDLEIISTRSEVSAHLSTNHFLLRQLVATVFRPTASLPQTLVRKAQLNWNVAYEMCQSETTQNDDRQDNNIWEHMSLNLL